MKMIVINNNVISTERFKSVRFRVARGIIDLLLLPREELGRRGSRIRWLAEEKCSIPIEEEKVGRHL